MSIWPARPIIYEINTWVWLGELSCREGRTITLGCVPGEVWDGLERLGVDAVWLMGVWERSPAGRAIAMADEALLADFQRVLPDFTPEDNVGSPYCIRRYVVDSHFGGPNGLAVAREELARRGVRLILDFVPNHVAPDHPWTDDHPEYFIAGEAYDLRQNPQSFMNVGKWTFARGRDPFFPAWPDVLQLNAFHPGLRRAMIETVSGIACQCDGIRCDMAMLVMNDIFEKTWDGRAGIRPDAEFWPEVIQPVRDAHPRFLFIAEAYWDREWDLQQQGFDFCYDKRLYDRLAHEHAGTVRLHLCAESGYQERLLRFIENHDEHRAADCFMPAQGRAAAVVMATIPGAKLFHEGQMTGRQVRLPVFLARRPAEPVDPDLLDFYLRLLTVMHATGLRSGTWQRCECEGWSDNGSHENILAWYWTFDEALFLIIVNYSDEYSQGLVKLPGVQLEDRTWRLADLFAEAIYERSGNEIGQYGLYVNLRPWEYHVFCVEKRLAE